MKLNGFSLKGIEVFCATARNGTVAQAAQETGLSLPAASQQIKKLELALGCELLDRQSRPMKLTEAGQVFLGRAKDVLNQIHLVKTELISLDVAEKASLRIGVIEDFENEITPMLLTKLSAAMTKCEFRLITGASHRIEESLRNSEIDIGIFTARSEPPVGIDHFDLLKDPYLIVTPKGYAFDPKNALGDLSDLQYIAYDRSLVMGRQIDAQLSRLGLSQLTRVEMDSYQSIYALVATGNCWTISTSLAYMSSARFWKDVDIHPLPFSSFNRTIILGSRSEWSQTLATDMAQSLRGFLLSRTVQPAHAVHAWLIGKFQVVLQ